MPGDLTDEYFKDKEVGETDSLHGTFDGAKYNFFCTKESDYVMKIMSTYGGILVKEEQRESKRIFTKDGEEKKVEFKYTTPFANHFDYHHFIDDHNNLRHQKSSIEKIWRTHRWESHTFACLLAVTEINVYLAFVHLVWLGEERKKLQDFYTDFSLALIDNSFLIDHKTAEREKRTKRRVTDHTLESAPSFAKRTTGEK